jgi:hypothetical protein
MRVRDHYAEQGGIGPIEARHGMQGHGIGIDGIQGKADVQDESLAL